METNKGTTPTTANQNEDDVNEPLPEDFQVGRHDEVIDFSWQKIRSTDKDPKTGEPVERYAPIPARPQDDNSKTSFMKWVGNEAIDALYRFVRQLSINYAKPANMYDPVSGEFRTEKFINLMQQFSARGMTDTALVEEKEELDDEIIKLFKDPKVSAADKNKRMSEIFTRMEEIKNALEQNKASREAKPRKPRKSKAEVVAEAAKKIAEAAKPLVQVK